MNLYIAFAITFTFMIVSGALLYSTKNYLSYPIYILLNFFIIFILYVMITFFSKKLEGFNEIAFTPYPRDYYFDVTEYKIDTNIPKTESYFKTDYENEKRDLLNAKGAPPPGLVTTLDHNSVKFEWPPPENNPDNNLCYYNNKYIGYLSTDKKICSFIHYLSN